MILTVGGEKGGPGKSTVATTMAAMRATDGRQVLLVNADAQSTSIHWATARRDHPEVPQVTTITLRGPKIHSEIAEAHVPIVMNQSILQGDYETSHFSCLVAR